MVATEENRRANRAGVLRRTANLVWRVFTSMRLAVILMLVLTALSLLGALLIQAPTAIADDPALYQQWVDSVAGNKVGGLAPLLSALSLFDVFHSPWFVIAGGLLMLNIIICSINRWGGISASLKGGKIRQNHAFYSAGNACQTIKTGNLPAGDAIGITQKVLKAKGYRVRSANGESAAYLAADKNRFFRLGTYASHASLVLFVLAFIAGNYFGFEETGFSVPEGSTRLVEHETDLSLNLLVFVDEYYPDGRPKDYRSRVVLYEGAEVVKEATVRVNHPLIYQGVRFYQSYFGPAVTIRLRGSDGHNIFQDGVALEHSLVTGGYLHYEGYFDIPGTDMFVRVIKPGRDGSPMITSDQVAVDIRIGNQQINLKLLEIGVPRVVEGIEFTYLEETQFSGFQVSRDPTNSLIWLASTLFIIGICAVLYFPYRQVWVFAESGGNGPGQIILRISNPRRGSVKPELESLAVSMEKELINRE